MKELTRTWQRFLKKSVCYEESSKIIPGGQKVSPKDFFLYHNTRMQIMQ